MTALRSIGLSAEAVRRLTQPPVKPKAGRKTTLTPDQIALVRSSTPAEAVACEVGISRRYVDLIRGGKRIRVPMRGNLKCPHCGSMARHTVTDVRGDEHGKTVSRRLRCDCGTAFRSVETVVPAREVVA